jgi:hypothetical protein
MLFKLLKSLLLKNVQNLNHFDSFNRSFELQLFQIIQTDVTILLTEIS